MNDIMIDIESGGTRPDANIFSIGAVLFDRSTGEIGDTLHIGLLSQITRSVDPDTMRWWMHPDQKQALIALAKIMIEKPYRIDLALEKLARFIARHRANNIWSNGASFDITILSHAYRQHDMLTPWRFWHELDVRTIVDACRYVTGTDPKKQVTKPACAHSALDDAIYQARYVYKAFDLISSTSFHGYET